MSCRVLVADATPFVSLAIRSVLGRAGCRVVAECATASSVGSAVATLRPDVAFIDLALPGGGIVAVEEIAVRSPSTAIVVLADDDDEHAMLTAVRAGARGYVVKEHTHERLAQVAISVASGEAALSRRHTARVMSELADAARPRLLGTSRPLSAREASVLRMLAEGSGTRDIGSALAVSEVTVRRHISAAIAKLGAKDRHDAVRLMQEAAA